jgi:hypothetical protein
VMARSVSLWIRIRRQDDIRGPITVTSECCLADSEVFAWSVIIPELTSVSLVSILTDGSEMLRSLDKGNPAEMDQIVIQKQI